MYKKYLGLCKWGFTISGNENEAEIENGSHGYDKSGIRPRHGYKYTIYEMCLSI